MDVEAIKDDPNKKRSRKKRKNFLSNAKKYAKKGQMGRGSKLPEELYQYFVGILDSMKQGIEDAEQRVSLVNNVMAQTKDEELIVVTNQLGCRVIEILLPFSAPEDFERFLDVLSPELRRLCSDNFSSHVVEALLRVSCERAIEHLQVLDNNNDSDTEVVSKKKKKKEDTEKKYTEAHIKKCYDFTVKMCKYALNNLEDFVWDSYANHILRSALKCLSGITLLPGEKPKTNMFKETLPDHKGIPPHDSKITYKIVPDEFEDIVKEFANRLSCWPQFKDMAYENLTSGLLQVLLYAVKNVDKSLTKSLVKKLLDDSFAPDGWVSIVSDNKEEDKVMVDDDVNENKIDKAKISDSGNLPPVFQSESAIRLLEAALFVSKKKMYTQIYAKCFINRIKQLATMKILNYTVQRLIDNCQIKEEFEPMFDELSDQFDAILACGNTGVLVAIARACLRVRAKQTQFISNLEAAFKCTGPENQKYFSICCLRLLPVNRIAHDALDKVYFINVHGSVILQAILDFQRPAKAVQSLLELTPEELIVIFSDGKGCHIADALCKGQCVGVKARDKLIWKLKGYYQQLALSKYGSRAFEQVFEVATPEQKIKIIKEISEKSNLLNSTNFGRLVAAKLEVDSFKSSQKNWEQSKFKKVISK